MDLETKVGQLFTYRMGDSPTELDRSDRSFLETYRPGGVIINPHNIESREQIASYVSGLQAANEDLGHPAPMIVCADQRGGDRLILGPDSGGLEVPAPIAQTAIDGDHEQIGYDIGEAMGRDVLDIGFNLGLAPYGDFREVVAEDESFGNTMMGSDPDTNAALSVGLARGMAAVGLGTTYCVFPSGYGSLDRDPHYATGVIDADEDELRDRYLTVPRAAIEAGVDSVMLSHFAFPGFDPEGNPATYSEPIIRDVLRDDLGFDGMVMTDAIKMSGAADHAGGSGEAAVRSIQAGADMILCSDWEELLAVEAAVREGRIPEARIDEAVRRVLDLKSSLQRTVPGDRSEPDPVDQGRMANLTRRSITWYRRSNEWETADAGDSVVAIAKWRAFLAATGEVAGDTITTIRLPETNHLKDIDVDDRKELVTRRTDRENRLLLGTSDTDDLELADRLADSGYDVCVVHAGATQQIQALEGVEAALLCYSHTPIACRKAIGVYYGTESAEGKLPVPLES
jgi:beta-N-acetylhexosaminidase